VTFADLASQIYRLRAGYDHPPGMSGDAAARPHALRLSRSRRCITRAWTACSIALTVTAWEGAELRSGRLPRAAGSGRGGDHCSTITAAVIQLQQQAAGCRQRPHEPIIGATACSSRSTLGEPACTSTTRSRSY
jgi:hypothetical protein